MRIYILSDLHYDYYRKEMKQETFFSLLLPADMIIIPGDVASKFNASLDILTYLSDKYSNVVFCLGNHDMAIYFDYGKFKTTEAKIDKYHALADSISNLHLLDGNIISIGDLTIGGFTGMWDYTYLPKCIPSHSREELDRYWKVNGYDGKYWNFMGNDIFRIREYAAKQISDVLSKKPDIVVSHYSPLNFSVPDEHKGKLSSVLYYMSPEYLSSLKTGAIWCSGHTHTAFKSDTLLINPLGYPFESPYKYNSLKKSDFLIDRW